jgi:hypothetical protein
MMANDNALSEEEFIEQAKAAFHDWKAHASSAGTFDVLEACEAFYMNGCADRVSGDVEAPCEHFYQVHRWIVNTDDRGFKVLSTFDTEDKATIVFDELNVIYDEWLGDDA